MDYTKIISASVVPVVIMSACGLLSLALYNRLAAVVSRLRGFQRERLREQEQTPVSGSQPAGSARHELMLEMLSLQTAHVTGRAKLLRRSLMLLLMTIATLILCSLTLGLSIIFPMVAYVAVVLFLYGMVVMFISIVLAMLELCAALGPVELESQFVDEIVRFQNTDAHDAA